MLMRDKQIQNPKKACDFVLVIWRLFGIWCLGFGAWDLEFKRAVF